MNRRSDFSAYDMRQFFRFNVNHYNNVQKPVDKKVKLFVKRTYNGGKLKVFGYSVCPAIWTILMRARNRSQYYIVQLSDFTYC